MAYSSGLIFFASFLSISAPVLLRSSLCQALFSAIKTMTSCKVRFEKSSDQTGTSLLSSETQSNYTSCARMWNGHQVGSDALAAGNAKFALPGAH